MRNIEHSFLSQKNKWKKHWFVQKICCYCVLRELSDEFQGFVIFYSSTEGLQSDDIEPSSCYTHWISTKSELSSLSCSRISWKLNSTFCTRTNSGISRISSINTELYRHIKFSFLSQLNLKWIKFYQYTMKSMVLACLCLSVLIAFVACSPVDSTADPKSKGESLLT